MPDRRGDDPQRLDRNADDPIQALDLARPAAVARIDDATDTFESARAGLRRVLLLRQRLLLSLWLSIGLLLPLLLSALRRLSYGFLLRGLLSLSSGGVCLLLLTLRLRLFGRVDFLRRVGLRLSLLLLGLSGDGLLLSLSLLYCV